MFHNETWAPDDDEDDDDDVLLEAVSAASQ